MNDTKRDTSDRAKAAMDEAIEEVSVRGARKRPTASDMERQSKAIQGQVGSPIYKSMRKQPGGNKHVDRLEKSDSADAKRLRTDAKLRRKADSKIDIEADKKGDFNHRPKKVGKVI